MTKKEMNDKIEKIKEWVGNNYNPHVCSYTAERSMDNYYDCFSDGELSASSWAAYDIGKKNF